MENFSYYEQLKADAGIPREWLHCLKYPLDQRVYNYGSQFRYSGELKIRNHGVRNALRNFKLGFRLTPSIGGGKAVLSNAYFSVNRELNKLDIRTFNPPWSPTSNDTILADPDLLKRTMAIETKLKTLDFNELIGGAFFRELDDYKKALLDFYSGNSPAALIVPNDMDFFSRLAILIFRELKIPSVIFLHGLPGRYNPIDDNQTDYLIVWGQRIKDNYVRHGIPAGKIYLSGHPFYPKKSLTVPKFGLENVLVVTKSTNAAQHSDGTRLNDRGNSILYLRSAENVLKKMGVVKARFRLHPSENPEWYLRFVDRNFYELDCRPLPESLGCSTLLIGPTSTLLLESVYSGVSYLVYEPSVNDIDLINFSLVPPFDGSDPRVPVAKNEEELTFLLKKKAAVDPAFIDDYIQTPFDISFLKAMI